MKPANLRPRLRAQVNPSGDAVPPPSAGFYRSRLATLLVLVISSCLAASTARAQATAEYFGRNCKSCHTIGGGFLTGPDLKDVTKRKDREWLMGFIMNPRAVIESGDPYALKILEESRNVPMPTPPEMTRGRAENLLELIDAESKIIDEGGESQFKGIQISTKPFTAADRERGRRIFLGRVRLEQGGTACISCHSMFDTPALGGGRLGPDLTNVFERLKGRKALSAWLSAPATETMQPIFRSPRDLTAEEIHALVAYFEVSAGESPADPSANRVALLLMGLAGAAAMVFAFDAIWKRRFHSVRRPLVDAAAPGGR